MSLSKNPQTRMERFGSVVSSVVKGIGEAAVVGAGAVVAVAGAMAVSEMEQEARTTTDRFRLRTLWRRHSNTVDSAISRGMRIAILKNPNVPEDIVQNGMDNESYEVRYAARRASVTETVITRTVRRGPFSFSDETVETTTTTRRRGF